jgi:hypothetical protein
MDQLSEKRLADIVKVADTAEANGWDEGTGLTRAEQAELVGISEYEYARSIQAIKEYPDLGISISTRRGRKPYTVISWSDKRLADDMVKHVNQIAERKAVENFRRTVRDAATSFVAYSNADKKRTFARNMKPYINRLKAHLMSVRQQAVSDGDPFRVREMTERALAAAGVHFTDNGDA